MTTRPKRKSREPASVPPIFYPMWDALRRGLPARGTVLEVGGECYDDGTFRGAGHAWRQFRIQDLADVHGTRDGGPLVVHLNVVEQDLDVRVWEVRRRPVPTGDDYADTEPVLRDGPVIYEDEPDGDGRWGEWSSARLEFSDLFLMARVVPTGAAMRETPRARGEIPPADATPIVAEVVLKVDSIAGEDGIDDQDPPLWSIDLVDPGVADGMEAAIRLSEEQCARVRELLKDGDLVTVTIVKAAAP